jgi:hypothetical protein
MLWLPTEAGALTCTAGDDLYLWYGKVDAVARVKIVGKEQKKSGETFYRVKVLRSWKNKVPKSLVFPAEQLAVHSSSYPNTPVAYPEGGEEMLLFLYRDESGNFQATMGGPCFKFIWGNIDPVQWLDQIESCGCKVFDAQGFHDAADLVVGAKVSGIRKEGAKTFAEINASVDWSKFEHDLPEALGLTVLTDDGRRRGCAYPVVQEHHYVLYLRRNQEGEYSTDICSGNLDDMQLGGNRSRFEYEQPKSPVVKKDVQSKCACEKLDARGLYDRADAIVLAEIERAIEKGRARFVSLNVVLRWKLNNLPRRITVYVGDVDSECRYPISQKEGAYLFYLRHDGKGGFSTDYCSGNWVSSDDVNGKECIRWLHKQEYPFFAEQESVLQEDACLKR